MDLIKKSPYADAKYKHDLQSSADSDTDQVFVERNPDKIRAGELVKRIYSDNLAFDLSETELERIGQECKEAYLIDLESNQDKFKRIEQAEKLSNLQSLKDNPDDPWPGAANTCHPQAAESNLNYWSRMLSAFLKDDQVAKYRVTGDDPTSEKASKAKRRGEFVSYYLHNHVDGFLQSCSSTFMQQPCNGKAFLKTFYDGTEDCLVVDAIQTCNLVANSFMKSVAKGSRYTHRYYLYGYEIEEKIRSGEYVDIQWAVGGSVKDENAGSGNDSESDTASSYGMEHSMSYLILEMFCRIDLDKDGYPEPYIVFIHDESGCVLRIKPGFDESTVFIRDDSKKDDVGENGEAKKSKANSDTIITFDAYLKNNPKTAPDKEVFITKIQPIDYITEIPFMPNVNGGFYGMGIVEVLVETIKMINRLSDSLINSGEAANYRGGFCSEDFRLVDGSPIRETKPNEYITVQFTGDDIRKHFAEFPRHEPSPVIFEMRNRLISDAEKFDGSTALMSGQMPSGNTPVGTVHALIEQGMQKYSAVMKMTYIGFRDFLRVVDRLLKKHRPKNMFYVDSKGNPSQMDESDWEDTDDDGMYDICPVADPNDLTNFQKFMKAQILMEAMNAIGAAGGNVNEVIRRYIESVNIQDVDKIITPESQPSPSPEMMEQQRREGELQLRAMESAHNYELERDKLEIELHKMRAEIRRIDADAQLKLADAESKNIGVQYEQAMAELAELQSRESMLLEQSQREREFRMKMQEQASSSQGAQGNDGNLQAGGGPTATQVTPGMGGIAGNPMASEAGAGADSPMPV